MASVNCSSNNKDDIIVTTDNKSEDKDKVSELSNASVDDTANDDAENYPTAIVIDALEQLLAELFPGPEHKRQYKLQLATAKGDNYLGVVYRINVLQLDSGDERHSLIVKVPPQNSMRRKQFFARPCFLRESLAYEQFLPLVAQYQQEHDVPQSERFCHYPACYRCLTGEQHEAIFLEDLCASGFRLFDRFGDLQPEHVRVVMRAYGKLHAVSLALKHNQPERLYPFQQIIDIFKQREHDKPLGAYFEQLKMSALGALDDAGGDSKYIERLKAYFESGNTFKLLLDQLDASNCEPYAVVCHGDCWNNNIMYRHDTSQVALEARLIDWQLMRYASPVTDLAYYFFTCTTKQFRDAHYNDMLNAYYDELTEQLKRLGTNSVDVFPRSAFDEQLRKKSAAGLLFAMMVLPIVTISGNDVPDLEAISEYIEAGNTTDLHGAGFLGARNEQAYKERIRGVIIDCVDHDYI